MTLPTLLLLVAQLPKASATDLGSWLVSGAAVGAVALLGRQLLGKDKEPGSQPVTHDELGAALGHHPRREEISELASRGDLVELDLSLRDRDRGITEGVELLRRQVAVLEVSQGHQSRLLASIADRLGVDTPPGEGRGSGR